MSYKGGTISVRGAEGQIYAGMTLMYIRIPEACRIVEVVVSLATQPAGTSALFDVRKNGTAVTDSIFDTDTPLAITTGQGAVNGLYSATTRDATLGTDLLDVDRQNCAVGDVLYVIATQIGSSFSGSDVLVQIRTS